MMRTDVDRGGADPAEEMTRERTRPRGRSTVELAVAIWGVGGVLLLVLDAIVRLTPIALEPITAGQIGWGSGAAYVVWVVANLYLEGYRGFQRSFTPVLVARAMATASRPRRLWWLAPLIGLGLMHATPSRLRRSWTLVVGIVLMVLAVRLLPAPWRGVVDAGVVAGLLYGSASIVFELARVLRGGPVRVACEFPEEAAADPVSTGDEAHAPATA